MSHDPYRVYKTVFFNIEDATASQTDTDVIENFQQKKPLIRTANVTGTNAADLKWYPGRNKGKTTVQVAAAKNATAITLVTSDAAGAKVNGRTVLTTDFLLVQLDSVSAAGKIWALLDISAVAPSAGNTKIVLTVVGFDGITGLEEAVTAANIAYIVAVEDVGTIDVDAASLQLEYVFAGFNGHPAAISINEGAGGTTHRANGVAQYVD